MREKKLDILDDKVREAFENMCKQAVFDEKSFNSLIEQNENFISRGFSDGDRPLHVALKGKTINLMLLGKLVSLVNFKINIFCEN